MANRLLLHIGAGKTGTSYLQHRFAVLAEAFAEAGVRYSEGDDHHLAKLGGITSGNGTELAKFLIPELPLHWDVGDYDRRLAQMLRRLRGRDVLFSSELLYRAEAPALARLARIAGDEGFDVSTILYVRSYAGHALSEYYQMIKRSRYIDTFERFLRYEYRADFVEAMDHFSRAFGESAVVVRNYDAAKSALMYDFVQAIGVDLGDARLDVPKQINRSLTPGEAEFMRHLNMQLSSPDQSMFASDTIIYASPERRTEPPTLDGPEIAALVERFGSTLDVINARIQGPPISLAGDMQLKPRSVVQLNDVEKAMTSLLAALMRRILAGESNEADQIALRDASRALAET